MPANAQDLKAEYAKLKNLRLVWETDWQRIADNMMYWQNDIMTAMAPGTSRDRYIYDTHAAWGLDTLTQHVMSSIMNFHTQWFGLRMEAVKDDREASQWFDEVAKIQNEAYTADSAFVPAAATQMAKQWLGMGTGCLFLDEQPLPANPRLGFRGFYAQHLPVGTYAIAEDGMGRVDTLYNECKMSAHEAANYFGRENLSREMQSALDGTGGEQSRHVPKLILHAIYPRKDRDVGRRDMTNMPWADVYLEMETDHIIREGGFRWFPCLVPRWEKAIPWAPWAFGRGHLALPESRTLQWIDYYTLQALPMHVYPPYWLIGPNASEAIGRVTFRPGAGNPLAAGHTVQPHESGVRYDIQQAERASRQERITRAFFLDFLQFLPPADKSQPEPLGTTQMRARFMAQVMGAPLLNFMGSVLNPLIDISFGLLLEAGAFPFPPDSVIEAAIANNNVIDPEYTGPLARAQNEAAVSAIEEALALGTRLSGETGDQLLRENLDFDDAYREWMRARGVPDSLIRDTREMERMRDAQRRREAAQSMLNEAEQIAHTAQMASPAVQAVAGLGGG